MCVETKKYTLATSVTSVDVLHCSRKSTERRGMRMRLRRLPRSGNVPFSWLLNDVYRYFVAGPDIVIPTAGIKANFRSTRYSIEENVYESVGPVPGRDGSRQKFRHALSSRVKSLLLHKYFIWKCTDTQMPGSARHLCICVSINAISSHHPYLPCLGLWAYLSFLQVRRLLQLL